MRWDRDIVIASRSGWELTAGVCTAGDFTLASAAPLHAMLQEGMIDKNVKFTPVLEGFRMPEYFDWELQPFTNYKVHTVSWKASCLFSIPVSPSSL